MDQSTEHSMPALVRLALLGASVALAWTALSLIVGATGSAHATIIPDGADLPGGSASVADVLDSPVAAVAPSLTAVASPEAVAAPIASAIAPAKVLVTHVAPVVEPVATAVAPLTQPAMDVVAAAPVAALTSPVVELAAPVVELAAPLRSELPVVADRVDSAPTPDVATVHGGDFASSAVAASADSNATSQASFSTSGAFDQERPSGLPLAAGGEGDSAMLPTPGGNSTNTGSNGAPILSSSPTHEHTSTVSKLSLSAFGREILPAAPAFDPGSTPD